MKAPAFNYARASSVQEAIDLLSRHGDRAKVLSGGQSLMPALNLRLLAPEWLIDIGPIADLRRISVENGLLTIGASTRHADLQRSPDIAAHAPLLKDAIAHVAHPAIRNRGTIGGSLAHADPASELPACMVALDATVIVQGPDGERRIPAADFFVGIYETQLLPDELLVAIEVPKRTDGARHFFREYARRSGDYAMAGLAAEAEIDGDMFASLRLSFFAVDERPILAKASRHLIGRPVTEVMLAEACGALGDELAPQDDHQATIGMRHYLARQLLIACVVSLLGRSDLGARVVA
ncbi:MAG: xanthine dehydrogenase family protein subunit M [Rhizobiales bacterium]|nr:xanthine dehydrogenase family protein subunit M [Hyphomicrobiales bacterium]